MISLKSCDTFVVLPPLTRNGAVVFSKNSDRPQGEVQEVVYIKGGVREPKLKCTYVTIDESPNQVNSVILSKPTWMWGAEMGANDKNVVIGNEAVWTNNNEGDGDARQKRLLGMDLVRLGLERGDTAECALEIITSLLEKYGQGGACSEHDDSHIYHNSFLIADPSNAWVLETSGKLWAAERVERGYRNISNGLTITTKIDRHSEGLQDKAKGMGVWDGQSVFNFTKCFSSGGDEARQEAGERLLREASATASFDVADMLNVLRDRPSRICRGCDDTFPTQGSQVSSLSAGGGVSVHWFTATPDPALSHFKPFVFTAGARASPHTVSPPPPNREHHLYELHSQYVIKNKTLGREIMMKLRDVETRELTALQQAARECSEGKRSINEFDNLFHDSVENELKFYA